MPRKRRDPKNRRPEVTPTEWWYSSDGLLGERSERPWENFFCDYPTLGKHCRFVWENVRDVVLPEWIKRHPGTRPSWWWPFDPTCPRLQPADAERLGWPPRAFWLAFTPEPRRRIGGTGVAHGMPLDGYIPELECGIPSNWITIDPSDPPVFESQAEYLDRHNLLDARERRRLKDADFAPEALTFMQEKRPGSIDLEIPTRIEGQSAWFPTRNFVKRPIEGSEA